MCVRVCRCLLYLLQELHEYYVRDALQCLLHSILFVRAPGSLRPREVSQELPYRLSIVHKVGDVMHHSHHPTRGHFYLFSRLISCQIASSLRCSARREVTRLDGNEWPWEQIQSYPKTCCLVSVTNCGLPRAHNGWNDTTDTHAHKRTHRQQKHSRVRAIIHTKVIRVINTWS